MSISVQQVYAVRVEDVGTSSKVVDELRKYPCFFDRVGEARTYLVPVSETLLMESLGLIA